MGRCASVKSPVFAPRDTVLSWLVRPVRSQLATTLVPDRHSA